MLTSIRVVVSNNGSVFLPNMDTVSMWIVGGVLSARRAYVSLSDVGTLVLFHVGTVWMWIGHNEFTSTIVALSNVDSFAVIDVVPFGCGRRTKGLVSMLLEISVCSAYPFVSREPLIFGVVVLSLSYCGCHLPSSPYPEICISPESAGWWRRRCVLC